MTDREKLVELLKVDHCHGVGIEDCYECAYSEYDDCYTARTADALIANGVVVREKGEWDTVFYERNGTLSSYSHLCPKCKYFYRDIRFKGHDFCPNCGADMRKGESG